MKTIDSQKNENVLSVKRHTELSHQAKQRLSRVTEGSQTVQQNHRVIHEVLGTMTTQLTSVQETSQIVDRSVTHTVSAIEEINTSVHRNSELSRLINAEAGKISGLAQGFKVSSEPASRPWR